MKRKKMARGVACSAALFLTLIGPRAWASDWSASLGAPALASYLDGEGRGVLVAAAGEIGPESRALASALEAALRATGKVKLAMGDSALGKLVELSDEQIVKKAQALPVDTIAVARVFPGPAGRKPTAVVTFYDKKASALSALSVEAGSPLLPRVGAGSAQGVPTAAMAAVAETGKHSESTDSPEDLYEQKRLWFTPAKSALDWHDPVMGKSATPVRGTYLYEMLGRPDLAASYRRRDSLRTWVNVAGGTAIAAGSVISLVGLFKSCSKVQGEGYSSTCLSRDYSTSELGLVVVGGGLLAMFSTALIDPQPISPAEARGLVDKYNEELKKQVNTTSRRPDKEPSKLSMHFGAFATRGGGGLTLGAEL